MKKTKLFGVLAIAFFLLNLVLVAFIVFKKPHHPPLPRTGPKDLIIEKLDLDADQVKSYEALIPIHQMSMMEQRTKMGQIKKELYESLKNDAPHMDEKLKSELIVTETKLQQLQYNHFKDIKEICREDQLENFNALTEEIARLFSENVPPPPLENGPHPPRKNAPGR
jgi:hypothetical protein